MLRTEKRGVLVSQTKKKHPMIISNSSLVKKAAIIVVFKLVPHLFEASMFRHFPALFLDFRASVRGPMKK